MRIYHECQLLEINDLLSTINVPSFLFYTIKLCFLTDLPDDVASNSVTLSLPSSLRKS